MALNQATIEYLNGRGLVRDGHPDRHEIIQRFAEALRTAVCDDPSTVQQEAKLVSDWRTQVLGDPDNEFVEHELNILSGQLLAIGPNGPVQMALEDGIVLCKVTFEVVDEDGRTHAKRGRIASSDPDIIERWHDAVKAAELVRKGQSTRASFDLSARRVPELARRHQKMLTRTSGELEQLLLDVGSSEGQS